MLLRAVETRSISIYHVSFWPNVLEVLKRNLVTVTFRL